MPYSYATCGLRIQSDRPIRALSPQEEPGSPDFEVEFVEQSPLEFDENLATTWYLEKERDSSSVASISILRLFDREVYKFSLNSGPQYVLDLERGRVQCQWPSELTIDETTTFLLGPILGFALRLRGTVCLHASAVALPEGAFALLGPSGAGKSTTAAGFWSLGCDVLSDDCLAIRETESSFWPLPSHPLIRLWPESAEALFGSANALPLLAPSWPKQFLPLSAERRRSSEPAPLGAIYLLGERSSANTAPKFETLTGQDCLLALIFNTYCNRFLDPVKRAAEFQVLGRLAGRVPLRRVTAPEALASIESLCRAIHADYLEIVASGQAMASA